jgi:DNA repair protein RecO (recombination protein O)
MSEQQRVEAEAAFVLHSRGLRERSLLLTLFTEQHGKINAVLHGARGNALKSSLSNPFVALLVSWQGKGDLYSINSIELAKFSSQLRGDALFSGLYINELLMHFCKVGDPYPGLFHDYQQLLTAFMAGTYQVSLRLFEKKLLLSLGYALSLTKNLETGVSVEAERYYIFDIYKGPSLASNSIGRGHPQVYLGASLIDLEREQFATQASLQDAKHLMRHVWHCLLDGKHLHSRKLFLAT